MDRNNFNSLFSRRAGSPAKPNAFTLIEVTISVALALVLMLGISEVFRIVGDTVGTGQALATAQRDARSAQAVMASDFNSAVSDQSPFMLLFSQQQWAFRNQADLLGDKDGDPSTFDMLGTGNESAQPPAIYNYRSHRIDCFTFFGRGSFARQTGADVPSSGASPFISNMGSVEAMLWYGHLNLADNTGNFTALANYNTVSNNTPGNGTGLPGTSTYYNTINPNNYFASSWILGRQQTLLQQTSGCANNSTQLTATPGVSAGAYPTAGGVSEIVDQSTSYNGQGDPQYAYMPQAALPLSPLSYNSLAFQSAGTTAPLKLASQTGTPSATLLSSRIDLAATSMLAYRNLLSSYIPTNTAVPYWWQQLPTGQNSLRFQAQPFYLPPTGSVKVTPESMAYQAPIFIRGCTQFTVEYAGDYLNQLPPTNSNVTAANQGIIDTYEHYNSSTSTYSPGTTDGQVDYIVSGTSPNLTTKIRWYGLPRSTTNTISTTTNQISINAANGDVTPLRDVFAIAATSAPALNSSVVAANIPAQAPFEMQQPTLVGGGTAMSTDYAPSTGTGMKAGAQYICAWGPSDRKPKMIRITMTIDDPGGRLGDGQTYEYIYTLP